LYGQEESVVWQHFVLIGPKIVDEFNRIPEPNQSLFLNGVDRGEWSYLNDSLVTGPQPLFATCNYADRGNNEVIGPLLDRFPVAVESRYPGVANEDEISDDIYDDKDDILRSPSLTRKMLAVLNSGKNYELIQQQLAEISIEYGSSLRERGIKVLDEDEKTRIRQEIKAIPLSSQAHLYFLFLTAELNLTPKQGDKRSIDKIDKSNGLYLSASYIGSGSRRATKALKQYAKSLAWMQGEKEVNIQHITALAPYVFWHRLQWSDEIKVKFETQDRNDPLDLYIAKTLLDHGTQEFPGIKRRLMESSDNYKNILDEVKRGNTEAALQLATTASADQKGHPIFWDAAQALTQKEESFRKLAEKLGKGENKPIGTLRRGKKIAHRITGRSYLEEVQKFRRREVNGLPSQHVYTSGRTASCPRFLTSYESIEALVNNYKSSGEDDKLNYLNHGFDTCTAVAYSGGNQIKITHEHPLIINPAAKQISTKYSEVNGVRINVEDDLFNQPLSITQVLNHSGWRELVNNDPHLLRELVDLIFGVGKYQKAMAFKIGTTISTYKHLLAPVFINSLNNQFSVQPNTKLASPCSFLVLDSTPPL